MPEVFIRYLRNPVIWRLALAAYWLALIVSTHLPIDRVPVHQGTADKFAHFGAFAGLAILLAAVWQTTAGRLTSREFRAIWILCILYGALEEVTQPFAGRVADWRDWLADGAGAAIGLAIFWRWLGPWLNRIAPVPETEQPLSEPRRGLRFSMKTLFALMTVTAIACFWFALPTIYAQQFARAIRDKRYADAERLFAADSDKFPGSFKDDAYFEPHASIGPLTWSELCNGERHINVAIAYGDGHGIVNCAADIDANRHGLELRALLP